QHRERGTHQVVEVSGCGKRGTEGSRHRRGRESLGGGLADRASDGHDGERTRRSHAPKMKARDASECHKRVGTITAEVPSGSDVPERTSTALAPARTAAARWW